MEANKDPSLASFLQASSERQGRTVPHLFLYEKSKSHYLTSKKFPFIPMIDQMPPQLSFTPQKFTHICQLSWVAVSVT